VCAPTSIGLPKRTRKLRFIRLAIAIGVLCIITQ
jgi:hypothetical protein